MVREVYLCYGGANQWVFPQTEGADVYYYPASAPLSDPPEGYPPVHISSNLEFGAVIQLNAALRRVFPTDIILVLIPPSISPVGLGGPFLPLPPYQH